MRSHDEGRSSSPIKAFCPVKVFCLPSSQPARRSSTTKRPFPRHGLPSAAAIPVPAQQQTANRCAKRTPGHATVPGAGFFFPTFPARLLFPEKETCGKSFFPCTVGLLVDSPLMVFLRNAFVLSLPSVHHGRRWSPPPPPTGRPFPAREALFRSVSPRTVRQAVRRLHPRRRRGISPPAGNSRGWVKNRSKIRPPNPPHPALSHNVKTRDQG